MQDKKKIRFLVMDVDGTLTDGKIYMGANGELMKSFDVKDGCGIKDILPHYGIIPVVLTARNSAILERRCQELNLSHLYQGIRNKKEKLDSILCELSKENHEEYCYQHVAYIGDDILDLQCMKPIKEEGGIVGCPADAIQQVSVIADFVSNKSGGCGAVREFIEWIVEPYDE